MTDVYSLKPNFSDRETYQEWKKTWTTVYRHISNDIRLRKAALKANQRAGVDTAKQQRDLLLQRGDARKLMTLLGEAKVLRDRILAMHQQLAEQKASFPITIETRVADWHFNKIVLQFPWMPKWVLKANGKQYYVEHLDSRIGFSTRELEAGSTLGMIRFRNCSITIGEDGTATLTERVSAKLAA